MTRSSRTLRDRAHYAVRSARPVLGVLAAAALLAVTGVVPAAAQYPQPAVQTQPVPSAMEPQTQGAPQERSAPAEQAAPQSGAAASGSQIDPLSIQGEYDIEELRRLIELARESGFTEEQIREITVEDENGKVVNAWAFLKAYDEAKQRQAAKTAAQEAKVYLSPKDILDELDKKQPEDLDRLRERMLFVE